MRTLVMAAVCGLLSTLASAQVFPSSNARRIGGIPLCVGSPSDGQSLTYNATNKCYGYGPGGGGGGVGTWGAIAGTLGDQTDLAAALGGKQASLGFTPLNAASNLTDLANTASARTALGLVIGTNVQAFNAQLAALAALGVCAEGKTYKTVSGVTACADDATGGGGGGGTTYTAGFGVGIVSDEIAVNSAVILSREQAQTGSDTLITLSSSGTATFVGAITSKALGAYTDGMVLQFRANFTSNGATTPTLNVNTLGAKNIYERDCVTPAAVVSGVQYPIAYNTTIGHFCKLSEPEERKFTIPYTQLNANGLSQAITLLTLPANARIQEVTMKTSTAFAGASLTTGTVSLGWSGSATAYADAWDLKSTVSATNLYQDDGGFGASTASHALLATFVSTGMNFGNGTTTALTAGSIDIWIRVDIRR